jgi:hypothetical protein
MKQPRRIASSLTEVLLERGRFTRREGVAVAVASIAFALVFCFPLLAHLTTAGTFDDWDQNSASQWSAYWVLHRYHQFPFWNPFECGGMPLLGDPQSHFVTPWFLLTMIFGPVVGLHLQVFIYDAIAWSGSYVLGRVLGLRRISAICIGTAFAGSSWFFLRVAAGHMVIMVFVYLPWIIAAGWKASERGQLRYAALCGAVLALSFFEGSPYPPLFEALTLALVLVGRAAVQLSARPLLALVLAAVFTAGLGAVKGSPAMTTMASHPRDTDVGFSNSFYALGESLLSRYQDHNRPSLNGWGFWESGAYVGLFAVIAVVGLLSPRKAIPWILTAIVLFQLARGWTGPNSLYVWLHSMPFFSSTRLPSRILIPFALMVAVLAGIGIDAMCSRGSPSVLAVCALLILIGGVDMLMVSRPNLHYVWMWVVPPNLPPINFVQFQRDPAIAESSVVRDSQGVVNCYVYTDWPTEAKGSNDQGYLGEQYMLGPGSVTLKRWTPNRLEYAVDAGAASSVMVINQNYDPSWRVMSGQGQAFSQDGLLAVRVPAGKSQIVLRYISMAAIVGLAISMLTALAAFMLIRWESQRPLRADS